MSYAGKLIIVTGASGGIGVPTAEILLERGADLLLIDSNEEALRRLEAALAAPARVSAIHSSLDSPEACALALANVRRAVYAVIHLAGVFVLDPLSPTSRKIWDRTLGANLTNAYDLTMACLPRLERGAPARVVFMSSLAFRRGSLDHVAYSAAKAGLVGLTRALSRALAPEVLVNAVAPGIIDTSMPAQIIRDRGNRLRQEIPLGRWGTAREVANVVEFLCGPQATYITGQVLNVDGGIVNS